MCNLNEIINYLKFEVNLWKKFSKMETPTNTPVLIEIEDDNQVLAFFLNTFHSALKMIVNLAILSTNIVLSPFVLTYMFWEYTIRKSWQITKQ